MPQHTLHSSPLAVTYAQSLLELAWDSRVAVDVGNELQAIGDILRDQPIFGEYLSDPGIGQTERAEAIDKIFRGRVSELVLSFLGVLNAHGRSRLLAQIVGAYDQLLDERLGNVEVDVTTAHALSSDQVEQVRQRISDALRKNAIIHQYIDDSIIGGLVIRVGDQIIDASVKQQLRSIRQQLLTATSRMHA